MDGDTLDKMGWSALEAQLAHNRENIALRGPDGQTLTYGALLDRIDQVHASLTHFGLTTSHRVALAMSPSLETAIALLALIGRVNLLPLNPAATAPQLIEQMDAGGVDALILGPDVRLDTRLATYAWRDGALVGPGASAPVDPTRAAGLVLQTSGSTGTPKRVPLTHEQLLMSAHNIADHLNLGPSDAAIHALPMFHVGAVVDLLLAPLLSGGSTIIARNLTVDGLHSARAAGGTWMQLVPTALTHLLDSPVPNHQLRFLRMVSADLSESLRSRAEAAFGVPVIQMYGMTETAGQITSNPLPPGLRRPLSVGHAAGPEIAIVDNQGAVVRQGGVGEVCVRGPTVMVGYEGHDETPRHGPWLRTGDMGRVDEDGYLFLTGRSKEIINRGGEKISPLTVERAALAIEGVQEAVAYAVPHATLGESVGLTVTASPTLMEATLLQHLREVLPQSEVPRNVHIASILPKLPSGKIDRRRIAQTAASQAKAAQPRTGLANTVAKLWSDTLKSAQPHDQSDFFDDGGDSLSATEFLTSLEARLGRPIPPNLLFEAPRFAALVSALEQTPNPSAIPSKTAPTWLPYLQKRIAGWKGQPVGPHQVIIARNTVQPGTKIFFGCHGDRSGNNFGRLVANRHPFYMLRSLREYVRDHHALYDELAAFYVDEISSLLEPNEDVILAGYCGGGLLTSVIAPGLIARGHNVRLFVAFDVIFEAPTPYPVVAVSSQSTRFSLPKRVPDLARRDLSDFHKGVDFVEWNCAHWQMFNRNVMRAGAPALRAYLDGARAPAVNHTTFEDAALRPHRRHASFRAHMPFKVGTGAKTTVKVAVKNTSDHVWPAYEKSGLTLVADFYRPFGRPLSFNAASAKLDHDIAPGEVWQTTLALSWPFAKRAIPIRLKLCMLDDGLVRFGTGGQRFVFRR